MPGELPNWQTVRSLISNTNQTAYGKAKHINQTDLLQLDSGRSINKRIKANANNRPVSVTKKSGKLRENKRTMQKSSTTLEHTNRSCQVRTLQPYWSRKKLLSSIFPISNILPAHRASSNRFTGRPQEQLFTHPTFFYMFNLSSRSTPAVTRHRTAQ